MALLALILRDSNPGCDLFNREQHKVDPEPVIDAEELRKRLLGPRAFIGTDETRTVQQGSEIEGPPPQRLQAMSDKSAVKNGSGGILGTKQDTVERVYTMSQIDPAAGPAAVAKMFEPTKVFEERLSKLGPAFDQVDRLGKDATMAFELVSELAEHLGQFAEAYAPVKAFQGEITVLAQKFDPFKGIQNQLTEMSSSFCDHLNYLVAVLEPANKIQQRLAQLAGAFEPAIKLKQRFQELAREFEILASPSPSDSAVNGADSKSQEEAAGRS